VRKVAYRAAFLVLTDKIFLALLSRLPMCLKNLCVCHENPSFDKVSDYGGGVLHNFVDVHVSVPLGHINRRVT